jgi:hypothetical protein
MGGPMRDHLRALLITLHIAAVVFLALPSPGKFMIEKNWRDPDAQQAFRGIAGVLGVPKQQVQDTLWELGLGWKRLRGVVVEPLGPYVAYMGVKQSWAMFAQVPDRSGRLEVHIEQDGEWRPLYISQDPEHDWRGSELRQERLRGALADYSWRRRKGRFPGFTEALALRAAADFPDATRLRADMVHVGIPEPAELRERGGLEIGEPYFTYTVFLEEFR